MSQNYNHWNKWDFCHLLQAEQVFMHVINNYSNFHLPPKQWKSCATHMARFLFSLNKVDLTSCIGRYSWAEGVLHSLVSLWNQKRTLDFGPAKKKYSVLGFFPLLEVKLF